MKPEEALKELSYDDTAYGGNKPTPEITPQLAKSAFAVLHQYCSSISPHDCIRCAFYEHCPECFMGCPGDQGKVIRKLQSNE